MMMRLQPPTHPTPELLAEQFAVVFDPVEGFAPLQGFEGFKERDVADIGTGDGAYSELCLRLGARSMTCFELDITGIQRAWDAHRLQGADIQIGDAATLSSDERFAGQFDVVTAYNIAPHQTTRLVGAARRLLKPGGDLVITSTEVGLMSRVAELERATIPHFESVGSARVWRGIPMPSSNFVTIAVDKRSES